MKIKGWMNIWMARNLVFVTSSDHFVRYDLLARKLTSWMFNNWEYTILYFYWEYHADCRDDLRSLQTNYATGTNDLNSLCCSLINQTVTASLLGLLGDDAHEILGLVNRKNCVSVTYHFSYCMFFHFWDKCLRMRL